MEPNGVCRRSQTLCLAQDRAQTVYRAGIGRHLSQKASRSDFKASLTLW